MVVFSKIYFYGFYNIISVNIKYVYRRGIKMQVQRIQNYNIQPMNNNSHKRQNNPSFTALSNLPKQKKGCAFFMALSAATAIAAITTPFITYNYLSENQKENGKFVNILTSVGTGVAIFGAGTTSLFHTVKRGRNLNNM